MGVILPEKPLGAVRPLSVRVFGDHAQCGIGFVAPGPLVNLLDHVDQLLGKVADILGLTFFDPGVQNGFERFALGCVGDFSVMLICRLSFLFLNHKAEKSRKKCKDNMPVLILAESGSQRHGGKTASLRILKSCLFYTNLGKLCCLRKICRRRVDCAK